MEKDRERRIIKDLVDACRPLDPRLGNEKPAKRASEVTKFVEGLIAQRHGALPPAARRDVGRRTVDMLLHLGPLQPLLEDETVTDITVNGVDDIRVDRGSGLEPAGTWFVDAQELDTVIDRLLREVHRRVDEARPMVDARLASGERVNVMIPPAAVSGPALTIRRFPRRYTPEELASKGTFDRPLLDLLRALVRARVNIVISGGAGTGKTTLLNALTTFIPDHERLVSIEDISELALFERRGNVVALEARPPSVEGTGEIDIRALVRNALRMRPDRIIVGEVRGPETLDMLQAMNTGHDGSITTVHANSSEDAVPRLLTLAAMTDLGLSYEALQAQIRTAVDVIVQLHRDRDGGRRVVEVVVVSPDQARGVGLDRITALRDQHAPLERAKYVHAPLPHALARRLLAAGESFPQPFRDG